MKVTLKGKIKLRGDMKVKRVAPKNGRTSIRAVRQAVRQEVRRGINQVERELSQLRAGIRRDFRKDLFSQRFSAFISEAVRDPNGLRNVAKDYVNKPVEVITTAGPIAGTLLRTGTDYLVVQESPSTLLIVPFTAVTNIRGQ